MFGFFKTKSLFEKHYPKFLAQPIIKASKNHKPITAAYLFVLSDFALMAKGKHKERNETAQKVFATLESKFLTPAEMKLFDKATDLFGEIVRGVTRARGDWCFSNDNGDNPVYNLFLCYGDLIRAPHYLDDYEGSPILIGDMMQQMNFTMKFNYVLEMTKTYLDAM